MIRPASYPSLEDRVVFVTGGGSGIGASIVEHFCAQRARVAFVDIQREASTALVETILGRLARRAGRPAPWPQTSWDRSACPSRRASWTTIHTSSPAACASAC